MSRESTSGLIEFIDDYNDAERSIAFVSIETFIIALCVGLAKESFGIGVLAWIGLLFVYYIPVINGILSLLCTLVESIFVFFILAKFNSSVISLYITLFAFAGILMLHRAYAGMSKISIGYSLIILESVVGSSYVTYIITKEISWESWTWVIVAVFLVTAFIPIIRIATYIIAAGLNVVMFYTVFKFDESIPEKHLLIITALVALYMIAFHIASFRLLNFKRYFENKAKDKEEREERERFLEIQQKLYLIYPELDKIECCFKNCVCQNPTEKDEFANDWKNYLLQLNESENYIDFTQYFEEHKLYQFRSYNRDFNQKLVNEYLYKGSIPQEQNNIQEVQNTSYNLDVKSQTENPAKLSSKYTRFELKTQLFDSEIEPKIYSALLSFINKEYRIIPHVSLREIFRWTWADDWILTNRVSKMHFDFVIYDKDFHPVFFLEVNGGEHKKQSAIRCDNSKQRLAENCGIKIVTIDASKKIAENKIEEKVAEQIKVAFPELASLPVYCPQCGSRMQIVKNRTTNKDFYGCTNYKQTDTKSKCNGRNIDDVPLLYVGMSKKY